MTRRYDITVNMPEGDEQNHGYLTITQVKHIFESMPVGGTLTITRTEDSTENFPARIGLMP